MNPRMSAFQKCMAKIACQNVIDGHIFRVWLMPIGKVEVPFPIHTSAVSMIMNIVDGTDVATKAGSKDVISLYQTARHRCDAVTE